MAEENEKAYLRPISPLVMHSKKRKVKEAPSTDGQESESSAFNLVSVINLKKGGNKEMYHSLDEILRQREEIRKRKEQHMRWMAGLPDQDQDQAQDNLCSKKKSKEDMLWFIRNSK
jgi:hypothetical protein